MSKHKQKINKEVYDDYRKSGFHLSVDMMINLAISKTAKAIFEDIEKSHCEFCGVIDGKCVDGETNCQRWQELRKKWVGD